MAIQLTVPFLLVFCLVANIGANPTRENRIINEERHLARIKTQDGNLRVYTPINQQHQGAPVAESRTEHGEGHEHLAEARQVSDGSAAGGRIVNGQDAVAGSHPHQLSLQYHITTTIATHVCGASLIAPDVVLTAAHCVDWVEAEEISVVVNDHRLYDEDGTEERVYITKIAIHHDWVSGQDFDGKVYPNDIAVLFLASRVTATTPIPLMKDDKEVIAGKRCIISGWGRNDTDAPLPNILQERAMTVMSEVECAQYWSGAGYLFRGHICVFDGENSTTGGSACNGDSGGPLVCDDKLAGVTSWGMTGCRSSTTGEFMPSVYARVSYYQPWVEMIIKRHSAIERDNHSNSLPR